ncbi:hypothetical protein GCM10023346_20730 [Arthrobacter gyeryongensis]|uniref:Uncharacterized protein n=1 Tax=Arthrobacter gyeryongensis TaxID=1650592 RepID=A0ABP9SDH8_9MICC
MERALPGGSEPLTTARKRHDRHIRPGTRRLRRHSAGHCFGPTSDSFRHLPERLEHSRQFGSLSDKAYVALIARAGLALANQRDGGNIVLRIGRLGLSKVYAITVMKREAGNALDLQKNQLEQSQQDEAFLTFLDAT